MKQVSPELIDKVARGELRPTEGSWRPALLTVSLRRRRERVRHQQVAVVHFPQDSPGLVRLTLIYRNPFASVLNGVPTRLRRSPGPLRAPRHGEIPGHAQIFYHAAVLILELGEVFLARSAEGIVTCQSGQVRYHSYCVVSVKGEAQQYGYLQSGPQMQVCGGRRVH